jgi:2-enoate reductase
MKLFEPAKIGRLSVKNRVVMQAMGTRLQELDGRVSQRAIDFYVARARGGVGLIVTGISSVEQDIEPRTEGPWSATFRADSPIYVGRLSELADAVHDYGAKLAVQLTAGLGRAIGFNYMGMRPVAPSEQPCVWAPSVNARELTAEEVDRLVNAFGRAASIVASAGVDAIEVHGTAGYLIDQFMTAIWNHRTDRYGGNLDGRLRFPLEIIKSIKTNVGLDFPVIFKYPIKHYSEGGREVEESLEIARRLEEAGVDAIDATAGCDESVRGKTYPTYEPPGGWVNLAEAVKKIVKIPVIAVGRLGYPEIAEKALQEGKADFIGLGRTLLADPEWPNKVKEGKLDDILMCTGCNDGCLQRIAEGKYVSCALNPVTGMEREFAVTRSHKRKSVLVVGGGPAGLEAARTAALRGHEVTLWEKGDQLGGNLIPGSVPEFKQDVRSLIRYLSTQNKKLGVKIEMGKEATPVLIQKMKPEAIVIATGATSIIPEIPGIEKGLVVTAVDLLLGKKEIGQTVIVVGGGLVGCEVALHLARKGKRVSIVEMREILMPDQFESNRRDMLYLLTQAGVNLVTEASAKEIMAEGLIVSDKSGERLLRTDTVVLALGLKSQTGPLTALAEKEPNVWIVGDCVKPRKILNAIWEGFRIARLI